MQDTSKTGLIFDLDGTLIESAPAITAVANAFLDTLGLSPLRLEETISFIGGGSQQFVRLALESREAYEPKEFDALFERFSTIYIASSPELNRPFPGAEDALREMHELGYRLALCTNKPAAPTQRILKALAWEDLFGAVIAGDTLAVKKPDPLPLLEAANRVGCATLFYVGDSETDAETARRASKPFVLFTKGYRKSGLSEIPHVAHFSSYTELAGIVGSLHS